MMRQRIRRVVVVERGDGDTPGALLGVLTTEDVAHVRGLDPVATTERIERAASVEELAAIRVESNRRLFRLYQQGVQSEDLVGVVNELDDQLKRRIIHLVAGEAAAAAGGAYEGAWAFLTFGSPGRRESTLSARQDNGLVWADPADPAADERARAYFAALASRANAAFERVGFTSTETGLLAREEPFRQPLSAWRAAYAQWAGAQDAGATDRAAVVFDMRALYGEDTLADALRDEVATHLPNDRLVRVLLQRGTSVHMPVGFLGRFELERDDAGREGINLRERGLLPIVAMARALALEAGHLRSSNTFDRLRHVAEAGGPSAGEAKALLDAYTTLSDLNLRHQMQQAERGETPSDRIDPSPLHRSQQNLLREAFKTIEAAQKALRARFGEV
jgi:CBS domain-containing protein